MVTLALIQGVLNTFVIFLARIVGFVVDRALSSNNNGEYRGPGIGYWITSIIAEIVLGFLASLIVMWFSRQREFRADAGGAKLAGRQQMIAALERLRQVAKPSYLPSEMKAFGINGGLGEGLKKLFMTHPPLAERIAALQQAGLLGHHSAASSRVPSAAPSPVSSATRLRIPAAYSVTEMPSGATSIRSTSSRRMRAARPDRARPTQARPRRRLR
jgi:hypothetical protein